MTLIVRRIEGVRSNSRRCVVFLEDDADEALNAKSVFDSLPEKVKRDLFARFEHWVDGGIFDDYHHGWKEEQYRSCYCFRWRRGTTRYRLYGFLAQPLPTTDSRFQICVLAYYGQKNTQDTDKTILQAMNRLKAGPNAAKAIREVFPDGKENVQRQSDDKKKLAQGKTPKKLDRRRR